MINDDLDARLKELDGICRPLLMLDIPDVTWTLEAFVAWAEPLIARHDAVNALTTEIIDMSITFPGNDSGAAVRTARRDGPFWSGWPKQRD